jgi:tRNA (cmo5U34)-methyltransferase
VTTTPIFPGEVFADTAEFDTGIRLLLPHYDEMLDAICNCVPETATHLLELGCGTGELTLRLLDRCPDATLVAMDYSPRMLATAKNKVQTTGYGDRVQWVEADFGDWALAEVGGLETPCDAVVSSLAIHHLTHTMKQTVFQRIYQHLKPGGVFWNADPVLPEIADPEPSFKQAREDWCIARGHTLEKARAGLGQTEPYGHSSQDQLATLSHHWELLKTAGFATVDVLWKYYGLAVFGGCKSATASLPVNNTP